MQLSTSVYIGILVVLCGGALAFFGFSIFRGLGSPDAGFNAEGSKYRASFAPIHIAAQNGNIDALSRSLKAKEDLEVLTSKQESPLFIACDAGQSAAVVLLLDAGAKVESRNFQGRTPLMAATQAGDLKSVVALLSHGADVNALEEHGANAAFFTASSAQLEVLKALVAAGSKIDFVPPEYNAGLLAFGCRAQNLSPSANASVIAYVRYLVEEIKLNIDGLPGGDRPLSFAAQSYNVKLVQYLLKSGANPNFSSHDKYTSTNALFDLVLNDSLEGDANYSDPSVADKIEIIKLLISAGANPKLPAYTWIGADIVHTTALELSEKRNDAKTIALFLGK